MEGSSVKIELAGLLGIVFIVLKLLGVIHWSWWWVLAPFWVPAAIWLVFMAVVLAIFLGIAIFTGWK